MLITEQLINLKIVILGMLAPHGWTRRPTDSQATANVGEKQWETAAATKAGWIYISPSDQGGYKLTADYQSEGRNILSTAFFHIPEDMSPELLAAGVEKFAKKVDAAVDDSYARRLFLRHGA